MSIPINNNIEQLINIINNITDNNPAVINQIMDNIDNQQDNEEYDENNNIEEDDGHSDYEENNDNYENSQEFNIQSNNLSSNLENYITKLMQNDFKFNNNDYNLNVMINTMKNIYTLHHLKILNRQINKKWFQNTEIIQTLQSESNDLSSYIVQLITDQSINLYAVLDGLFNEHNDKQKIINIGALVQEWINNMEYVDGAYHLNISGISDFNTLILWTFIMCADIKFTPAILNSHLCTHNIFSIEFLQRKAGNISLMMMSVWKKDIRDIIVKNIGSMLYTTLLNEEIEINNNLKMTLLEMSIYCNTFYDMLKDNIIDPDVIVTKDNDTIYHLLCKSISPLYRHIRGTQHYNAVFNSYDLNFNELDESIKQKLLESKLKQNSFGILPISYLVMSDNKVNFQYLVDYLNDLKKFIKFYNYDDIFNENFTINKTSSLELFLMFDNNKKFNTSVKEVYEKYFINYLCFKNCDNHIINKLNLHMFSNNYTDNINNFLHNNDFTKLCIHLNIIKKKNYYESIQISENLIEKFIDYMNLYTELRIECNNLIEFFLFKFPKYDLTLFKMYYMNKIYSGNYITNLERFYQETNRNEFAQFLIEVIDISENTDTYKKFLPEIMKNLNQNTFKKLFNKYHFVDLIKSNFIPNEIKFGDINDNIDIFTYIIDGLDNIINVDEQLEDINLDNIEKYSVENLPRILLYMTNIIEGNDFNRFLKIFKINEDFINQNLLKDIYVNMTMDKTTNSYNIKLFLNKFHYTKNDNLQISKLIDLNTIESNLFLEHFSYHGLIDDNNLINIIERFHTESSIPLYSEFDFFNNLIQLYNQNEYIMKLSFNKIFNIDMEYDMICKIIEDNPNITNIIQEFNFKSDKNISYLIKYYFDKNKDITSQLVSTYNNIFIETNYITFNDKINILYEIIEFIEHRIPKIIINKSTKKDINIKNITKFVKICEIINYSIPLEYIDNYPELIHCIDNKKLIDTTLNKCLDNYDIFSKIVNFEKKSDKICKKLLKLTKDDIELYIECIIKFNNIKKDDIELIFNHIKINYNFMNYILENDNIKKALFKSDKNVAMFTNNVGNYLLSYLKSEHIEKYIKEYTLDDLKILNINGIPRIFNFLDNENIINILIEYHGLENLINICDNFGKNIYDKMINLGMFTNIPESYILNEKNIIHLINKAKSDNIVKLFSKLSDDKFNQIIKYRDIDGNTVSTYLAKFHPNIFKELIKNVKINKSMFGYNYSNETFLMNLIKYSKTYDLENIIRFIVNNIKLEQDDYFVNMNYGSVLSYCLKYNPDLFNLFYNTEVANMCMNVYDSHIVICPFSDNSKFNPKLNLYQLSSIIDHTILDKLLKLNKRNVKSMLTNIIKTDSFEHNLLSLVIFNNPESIQPILNQSLCDVDYIKSTEDKFGGFEKVIDIQPASWYYLQNSLKIRDYKLKLSVDDHWYGYNYKRKMTEANIGKVTHYILDKQELPENNNVCNICDTYKRKIVFSNCRHKVCIVCAIHSDKCGTCRNPVNDKDKILM